MCFPDVCDKCVYLDIACVSHICCMCFIWMLHIFCNWFLSVFMCFYKCFRRMLQVFQLFRTYVINVSFGCLKYRSGIASPSSPSATSSRCLLVSSMLPMFGQREPTWGRALWVGSRLSGAESEPAGRGAYGLGPRARRSGASLTPTNFF
jgi:hypothetical protein